MKSQNPFITSKVNLVIITILVFINHTHADNFNFNTYNNHGVIGLINTPSARFYDEGAIGITIYDGTPDQKITITSSPYDWLEASFFYTNIQGKPYPGFENQDYKDKGFNFKLKLKEEGLLPAIAIGINDIAGTGYYSSEYLVGNYGIGNLDLTFGLGWGTLNGLDNSLRNPLTYIHDSFNNRPEVFEGKGGQFQPSRYFSDKSVSPFFGISYVINDDLILKIERDTTKIDGFIDYQVPSTRASIGLEYNVFKNFTVGLVKERGNFFSLKFILKQDASSSSDPYKYKKVNRKKNQSNYTHFINSLSKNGLGVNKIIESAEEVGIEITQFSHPNLDIIEEIIYKAKKDSGITKNIKSDYRIADLDVYSNIDQDLNKTSKLIYKREANRKFNSNTKLSIRPFLAAREGFFKVAILVENNNEYIIKDNFFFSSNLKYSIKDNFGDLVVKPSDTYPAQVRSDVKEYLKNFENRLIIGRAQFDYHITPRKNNHVMLSAGILEEMFSGYGIEYLYFDIEKNYAIGAEVFKVKKRDYDLRFGSLDYENVTGHLNMYYRNNYLIPFDAKISYGQYLAGDVGTTFELSRSYRNGAEFGIFASFTNVTEEQFGEGSFDKGIFFNIPIYKNFAEYRWRPLTKDPGAKLNRKNTLHDLLVKFRPHNSN